MRYIVLFFYSLLFSAAASTTKVKKLPSLVTSSNTATNNVATSTNTKAAAVSAASSKKTTTILSKASSTSSRTKNLPALNTSTTKTTTTAANMSSTTVYTSNSSTITVKSSSTSYSYSLEIPKTLNNKYISVPTDVEDTVYIAVGVLIGAFFMVGIIVWFVISFKSYSDTKKDNDHQRNVLNNHDIEKNYQTKPNYNNLYSASNLALDNASSYFTNESGHPLSNTSSSTDSTNSQLDFEYESDITEKALREKHIENPFTLNSDTMFISPIETLKHQAETYTNGHSQPYKTFNNSDLSLQIEQTMISPINDSTRTNSVYGYRSLYSKQLSSSEIDLHTTKQNLFRPPSMHLDDLLDNS